MSGAPLIHSQFDSDVFGMPFLRVAVSDVTAIARNIVALEHDRFIVDAKVPAEDAVLVCALAELGFFKVSTLVEFAALPDAHAASGPEISTALSLAQQDLRAHAEGFRFQRFRQDRRISEASSIELMERWIANSLAGRRETLAIDRNFCTYSVHDGKLTVDLLSCLDTRRGVAGRLLAAVHATARSRACNQIAVTTEAENVGAMRTYMRAGFRPVRAWAAMHFVRN